MKAYEGLYEGLYVGLYVGLRIRGDAHILAISLLPFHLNNPNNLPRIISSLSEIRRKTDEFSESRIATEIITSHDTGTRSLGNMATSVWCSEYVACIGLGLDYNVCMFCYGQ